MKVNRILAALVLLSLLWGVSSVGAQGVVSLSIDEFYLENFPTGQAFVTVRNENGVPIVGLEPDKFEIVEDGKTSFPPSTVSAHVNHDAVVSVVLVIDVSGSMKGKPIEEAMRAANALLDQLSDADRVAIVAFADTIDVDPENLVEGRELDFTADKNAVRNVVNFLDTQIGWDTPLYDAIYKGVKMVSTEPAGKRAVIVLTDGKDERDNDQGVTVKDAGSTSTPDDPILEANRHNIPIFSVGQGSNIDTKYLSRLAERTGGVYQQAPEPEELTPTFEKVVNQLKQQYSLTYDSSLPEDGSYHSLLVRVNLPQGQAWAETKFQFSSSGPPPDVEEQPIVPEDSTTDTEQPDSPADESTPEIVALVNPTSPAAATPTVVTVSTESEGIADRLRDTIEDKPLLAAVVGGGALLLLILVIVLLVVLLRGRGATEDEYDVGDYEADYGPPPDWSEGVTSPSAPAFGTSPSSAPPGGVPPAAGMTEVATSDWAGSGMPPSSTSPSAPPPPPPQAAPAPGMPPGGQVPAAGSTRIIERAPTHMAMLVEKARPDQKHDVKGMTNVGRAPDNDVVLDDPTVSRHHAWIKVDGEDFLVFDIGSGNGTFLNDQLVEEPKQLSNGDVVRFGEVELVFTKVF